MIRNIKRMLGFCTGLCGILLLLPACAIAQNNSRIILNQWIEHCSQSKQKIYTPAVSAKREYYAYLFACAVSVSAAGSNEIKLGADEIAAGRMKLAEYILTQKIDINYINQNGDNLLSAAVISFLPETWKEKIIQKLLELGVSAHKKNMAGISALDCAKELRLGQIVTLLESSKNITSSEK